MQINHLNQAVTQSLFLLLGRLKQGDHLIQEFKDRLGNILRPLSNIKHTYRLTNWLIKIQTLGPVPSLGSPTLRQSSRYKSKSPSIIGLQSLFSTSSLCSSTCSLSTVHRTSLSCSWSPSSGPLLTVFLGTIHYHHLVDSNPNHPLKYHPWAGFLAQWYSK